MVVVVFVWAVVVEFGLWLLVGVGLWLLLLLLLWRVAVLLGLVAVGLVGRWLGVVVILVIRLQLLLLLGMRKMSVSHTPRASSGAKDKPEVGTVVDCRSNADSDDDGYCTLAARGPRARRVVMVGCNPPCSVAVAKVGVKVAEVGGDWRCMVVGVGWLVDEGGSFALQRSNRLLPYPYHCLSRFCTCVKVYKEVMYKAADE